MKYGFMSHSCSCFGSLFIGIFAANLIVLITAALFSVDSTGELYSHTPLFCIGIPIITAVLWSASYLMIWTPAAAYRLVKCLYQDYWQSGKEIWRK